MFRTTTIALLSLPSLALAQGSFYGFQKTNTSNAADWGLVEVNATPFDGSTTRLPTASFSLSDLTFDASGTLWAQNSDKLATVDVTTGAVSNIARIVAPSEPSTFLQVQDMAFAPNGTLYATGQYLSGGSLVEGLYTIDTATAQATIVAEGGFGTFGFDGLAFTLDGRLIASEIGGIREIDPADGSVIATLPLGISDALSLTVDPITGLGYAVGFAGANYNTLYEIDFGTNSAAQIATLDEAIWDLAATPAPGAITLFGAAGLVGFRRRRA
ncbi:MAG: hypothetical protein Tsb0013_05720 [Phycisphaerales bacterium]